MKKMEDIAFKIIVKTYKRYKLKSGCRFFDYQWFNSEKLVFTIGVFQSYGIEIILIYKKN